MASTTITTQEQQPAAQQPCRMSVLQEQLAPGAAPGQPFVVPTGSTLQLADGYFYSCYDVCDWTTGCTKVCGADACPAGAAACSQSAAKHTKPLYRIESQSPHTYGQILEQRGVAGAVTTQESVYVPVAHVEERLAANATTFVNQLAYLDSTSKPTWDGMMSYSAPSEACVRISPCTGPAAAAGICCGALPAKPPGGPADAPSDGLIALSPADEAIIAMLQGQHQQTVDMQAQTKLLAEMLAKQQQASGSDTQTRLLSQLVQQQQASDNAQIQLLSQLVQTQRAAPVAPAPAPVQTTTPAAPAPAAGTTAATTTAAPAPAAGTTAATTTPKVQQEAAKPPVAAKPAEKKGLTGWQIALIAVAGACVLIVIIAIVSYAMSGGTSGARNKAALGAARFPQMPGAAPLQQQQQMMAAAYGAPRAPGGPSSMYGGRQ